MWNLDPDKHICRVRFGCLCELNELYLNICKEYPSLYSTAWCMKPEQVCFIWQKMNVSQIFISLGGSKNECMNNGLSKPKKKYDNDSSIVFYVGLVSL